MLEFRLLGPLEVVGGDGPIALGGPKQRATLAILLLGANRVVPVERLADDLYHGAAPVTAVTQVQRQVSELRRLLGAPAIETRPPGYILRLAPEQLDLHRFERLTERAAQAQARERAAGRPTCCGRRSGSGAAPRSPTSPTSRSPRPRSSGSRSSGSRRSSDGSTPTSLSAATRSSSASWRSSSRAHPFGERFTRQLMLALYRSGRQAEALTVYRATREALVEEFGIEPTPLAAPARAGDPHPGSVARPRRARPGGDGPAAAPVLVLPSEERAVDGLLGLAAPLARCTPVSSSSRVCSPTATTSRLPRRRLNARREALDLDVRTAAFTTSAWADDAVRLASTYDVALVLLDAPSNVDAAQLPGDVAALLERSAADVGLLAGPAPDGTRGEGVFVPFGGGEHDWAALELGAWLASATDLPLRLVGTKADASRGRRDASRLLADASLAVQRVVGVAAEPLLAEPTDLRSSPRSSRRPSSCSASRRAGGWTASARPGGARAQRALADAARARRAAPRRSRAARERHALHLVDPAAVADGQEQTLSLSAM